MTQNLASQNDDAISASSAGNKLLQANGVTNEYYSGNSDNQLTLSKVDPTTGESTQVESTNLTTGASSVNSDATAVAADSPTLSPMTVNLATEYSGDAISAVSAGNKQLQANGVANEYYSGNSDGQLTLSKVDPTTGQVTQVESTNIGTDNYNFGATPGGWDSTSQPLSQMTQNLANQYSGDAISASSAGNKQLQANGITNEYYSGNSDNQLTLNKVDPTTGQVTQVESTNLNSTGQAATGKTSDNTTATDTSTQTASNTTPTDTSTQEAAPTTTSADTATGVTAANSATGDASTAASAPVDPYDGVTSLAQVVQIADSLDAASSLDGAGALNADSADGSEDLSAGMGVGAAADTPQLADLTLDDMYQTLSDTDLMFVVGA
jgi:hypothetical protein